MAKVCLEGSKVWFSRIRRDVCLAVGVLCVERLFASRNRNPKEGGPDSPPWMTHEQGRSASSNQGIPPHYAVLDLGTTMRESVGKVTRKPGPLAL